MGDLPNTPIQPRQAIWHRLPWKRLGIDWLPLGLWMALIYWSSSQPRLPGPGDQGSLLRDVFNYSAHACGYAFLTWLAWRAFRGISKITMAQRYWVAGLWAALYAASDEHHQRFVPGRTASLWDFAADIAGILAMLALLALWTAQRGSLRRFWVRRTGLDLG